MNLTLLRFTFLLLATAVLSSAQDRFTPAVMETILSSTRDADATLSAKRSVLLCWSRDDHPKGTHSYQGFANLMSELLNQVENVDAKTVQGFPDDEQWVDTDLVVFYLTINHLTDEQYAKIDTHLKQGKSIIVLHQGLVQRKRSANWAKRIGYAFSFEKPGASKWGPMDSHVSLDTSHPILSGFPDGFHLKDELYWNLRAGEVGTTTVLATTGTPRDADSKAAWPVLWTVEHPAAGDAKPGRVFCSVVGHLDPMNDAPYYRSILLRAMAWCMREPFAPFEPLVNDPKTMVP